jgi:signal peptidase I
MPGDTLEMHDIVLFLNGRAWSEDYVRFSHPVDVYSSGMSGQCEHAPAGALTDSCRPTRDNRGPIVVPDGCHFMMGDNREDSETPAIGGSSSATRFAADPSSSDMHSIPCPDALRDGSPVSGGAAPAMPCSDVSGLA